MVSDPEKNALISNGTPDPLLMQTSLLHVDFLVVEGLKELPLPKLVVVDDALKVVDLLEKKVLTNVVALVAPVPAAVPETFGVPVFQRDNINEIADCIINRFLDKASRKPVPGLVLAGGKSSRMDKDKALLTYHTQNQLIHTAKMLEKQCEQVYISCRTGQQAA